MSSGLPLDSTQLHYLKLLNLGAVQISEQQQQLVSRQDPSLPKQR
jgi:hypothetical protein